MRYNPPWSMHSKKQIELSGCTANCDDDGRYALHDGLFYDCFCE